MLQEFKKLVMRGNVLDLAVAVIIGGAFGKIVTSLVNDIIMPLLGVIMGGVSFAELQYQYGDVAISYGLFLQSILDFLLVTLSIFIFIKLISSMKKKEKEAPTPVPVPSQEIILLGEIRDLLSQK
ncbi:MAG: large-conductance mechanosensitive channel protein MscL [Firmicutes bacterium]|nr:large-conductance mechanosensitive channel protein MscL [Bacillota bacterium]